MPRERRAAVVAWICTVGAWMTFGWSLLAVGGRAWPWLLPLTVATALGFLPDASVARRTRRPEETRVFLRYFVAWLGLSLASLMLVQTMEALGVTVLEWADLGARVPGLIAAGGLVMFGNALPRLGDPMERDPAAGQRVRRLLGWALVVIGLSIAVGWVVHDPPVASRLMNRLLAVCFFFACVEALSPFLGGAFRSSSSPSVPK